MGGAVDSMIAEKANTHDNVWLFKMEVMIKQIFLELSFDYLIIFDYVRLLLRNAVTVSLKENPKSLSGKYR